jgi:ATP-dependent helicase/nuclease subunit B
MPAIEKIRVAPGAPTALLWDAVAAHTLRWLRSQGVAARDAVLLLPYAALAEPARAAFLRAGGWQPRIETVLTLAGSWGPPEAAPEGACTGDTVLDRLQAAALLRQQAWGQAWQRRDPQGFERVVAAVVEAAQALRQGLAERAPDEASAYWDQVRAALLAPAGPAAAEALLLQLAQAWAAASGPADTAVLHRAAPGAWVALRLGGPDAVAESLLACARCPALVLDADPDAESPFDGAGDSASVQRFLCQDFEDEAQAAAAVVMQALHAGQAPVALVVLDRELVRRVLALLARHRVPVIDETGWKLATTDAAVRVLALLRAAQPDPPQDAVLEWLKVWPPAQPRALDALEALWRQRRHVPDAKAGLALWDHAQDHLQPLAQAPVLALAAWLQRLAAVLGADGSLQDLADDAAGAQVLGALRLVGEPPAHWQAAASALRLTLPGFVAWVRDTLEEAPFLPLPDPGAQVVLTPLSRAFGRPFGHVVVPGADHKHLGSAEAPPALIGDALAQTLGLDHAQARRHRQRLALAQLLRAPQVTLLRRHRDDEEPLGDGPPLQALLLARAQAQLPPWPLLPWQSLLRAVQATPVARPLPQAGQALPQAVSATQLDTLRACPYRFFARAVLRLEEPEELDQALAKRDYGTWLHAVLHHFHSQRMPGQNDAQQLAHAADAVTAELGVDAGELLPFRTSFDQLVRPYLLWLQAREAQGWFWADGESDHRLPSPDGRGPQLRGRLDRVDHGPGGLLQLLDYKSGSAKDLQKKVKLPLEDTQLAFYAALLGGGEHLSAAYLAMDDAGAPLEIPHPKVHDTVQVMLAALGDEWQRLREGEPLAALGEGTVCDTCEARGLCRRDQWGEA